jgi:PAB-dependent poly(A)-specific ribonuclease subunit 3
MHNPQPTNPYLDPSLNGATYYQNAPTFHQTVLYHNYAPLGPYPMDLLPYQRIVHDLFIPNDLREDMHKKHAAALQTLPNSQLPAQIENYHSLVPLDINHSNPKSPSIFAGYKSWVYKVQSSQNGQFYVLRRIEGFKLTNELAIRTVQAWKLIMSASVVKIVDAFTTRSFGDSSLVIVTDYHPLSKTAAEQHTIGNQFRHPRNRNGGHEPVPESVMWSYVTQIASALKTIHSAGLAARVLDPSKLLITGKNRVRLNGCAVLDVIQYEKQVPASQLQRQDLVDFGLLIVSLGSNISDASNNFARSMDQFKKFYKSDLQQAVIWLYSAMQTPEKSIDQFIKEISVQMLTAFNGALHNDDVLNSDLGREVENGRLFRLMAKLGTILERPEFEHDRHWSENGERYIIKLFRDYVFHQVDAQGRPAMDLGHILASLNKLDAGSDERVTLMSRDEQSVFVVSYKELKKATESAFQDLVKGGRRLH